MSRIILQHLSEEVCTKRLLRRFHIYNNHPLTDFANPLALANQTLPSGCRRRCHLWPVRVPKFKVTERPHQNIHKISSQGTQLIVAMATSDV